MIWGSAFGAYNGLDRGLGFSVCGLGGLRLGGSGV